MPKSVANSGPQPATAAAPPPPRNLKLSRAAEREKGFADVLRGPPRPPAPNDAAREAALEGGGVATRIDAPEHAPAHARDRDRDRDADGAPPDDESAAPPLTIAEGPGFAFRWPDASPAGGSAAGAPPVVGDLFAQLVRTAAIGGDARRASIRLELGGRVVDRGEVVVHADGDEVEIEIAAPAGVDAARLEARVSQRLAGKGLKVTRFDVR